MEKKTYNGWTNYETWNANLHFDNFFEEEARSLGEDADTSDEDWLEDAISSLSETIKITIEDVTLEGVSNINSFANDMINSALREINYYEIAQGYEETIKDAAKEQVDA